MEIRVKGKNKIFSLLMAIVALMALMACGGDDDKESLTEGQTFQQSVTLAAQNADETVTLTDLNSAIKDIEYSAEWLTVIKQTYTSGSPSLRLIASDNVKEGASTDARKCMVTVTVNSGDRVLLTVTQEGAERRTGIDDSHDIPTDQPAYSRQL